MPSQTRLPRPLLALSLALALALPALAAAQDAARWSVDAVLDTRTRQSGGIPVLAVTPGGAADRMGLAVGDRIVSVNGTPLAGSRNPQDTLDTVLLDSGGRAVVVVSRDGTQHTLQGELGQADTPAAALGCGYVTASDPTPGVSERVYAAEITQIDGRSTPLQRMNRFPMDAGQHVLVVRELIPEHQFNNSQLLQRRLTLRRLQAKAYKALVVDVQPGMRYRVGARLLDDALDNDSIRANAYWEPVVYGSLPQACP